MAAQQVRREPFPDSQLSIYLPRIFKFSISNLPSVRKLYRPLSGKARAPLHPTESRSFDMDGVLFNSMPYHADAWHKVMERHGLHLSREEAYMHEGRTGASTINIVYQRQYGKDATPEMIESIYAEKSAEFSTHPEPERMPGAWEVLQR